MYTGGRGRRQANPFLALLRMTTVTLANIPTRGAGRGAISGILAGAVAVGISQLVAGITGPGGAPVVAVGEASIDAAPPAVKNFAISAFGSNDKLVLLCGIGAVLTILAAVIGVLALRKLWHGLAGLGVFAVIGLIAAATRPTATAAYVLPTLAGAAAGAYLLMRLTRAADPAAVRARAAQPGAQTDAQPAAGGNWPLGEVPVRARPAVPAGLTQPERRKFLVTSVAAAGTAAVSGLGGRYLGEKTSVNQALRALRVPAPASLAPRLPTGSDFKIPGLSPFVTPNKSFYRVDTAIVLPEVLPASWHLRIHGMVQREINLSYAELIRRPLIEDYITLTCVSNPVAGPYAGNALWLGTSLRSLLREAGIKAGADQLYCTSSDGFTLGSPVQTAMDGRDSMLAIAMNGQALPVEHGFPVRMVVPGLYGYVSACKWIVDIEVTTYKANVAYWAQRGWSQTAPIKTESRIDVPSGLSQLKPGRNAIAGVAWAQHKGIEAVEVRVDSGPWKQANLATVPGIDTWRQWALNWDATPGKHLIEARATDQTGYTQTTLRQPPEPNGASGYPSVPVTVSTR
jgi:DMSO/TMAO reductase YedYZ molybdopterin-dependent catalytic subunit